MRFAAIEYQLPSHKVTNGDMIAEIMKHSRQHMGDRALRQLDKGLRSLFQAAGTEVRYVRAHDEKAHDLIMRAATSALRTARMAPSDIDLLIWVGVGRGFLEPATANVFLDELGLVNATCFDVLDACASWVRALHIAHAHMRSGDYRNVMILNGEFNVCDYIDYEFKSLSDLRYMFPSFTIGEAATATILCSDAAEDDYHASFRTYGSARNLCMIPLPNINEFNGTPAPEHAKPLKFFSYSMELFELGVTKLIEHYRSDPKINQYFADVVFGHAASDSASERIALGCNEKGLNTHYFAHARFGNTVSASVPLAMGHALEEGRLKNEMKVMIAMASAGLSTGWARFRFRM
jgi:3-oxoacyl-[acyl-carrier-protein] synthase III